MLIRKLQKSSLARYIAATIVCVLSGLIILVVEKNIETKFRQEIEQTLTTLVKTTQSSLELITKDHTNNTIIAASYPELVNNVNSLLLKDDQTAEKNIEQLLQPLLTTHGYLDYYIVTKENRSLASSDTKNINFSALKAKLPEFFQQVWQDRGAMSRPFNYSIFQQSNSQSTTDSPTLTLLGSVIKDSNNNIIAALLITASPDQIYGNFFNNARIGRTGETYIINKNGLLLTSSPFDDEKHKQGLLEKGSPATLNTNNIAIRVIQYNYEYQYTDELVGVDSDGYSNYRGRLVVGAKLWDSARQILIVSEIDKAQAYGAIRDIRRTSLLIYTIYCLLIFVFIYFYNKYITELARSRERREQSDLRLRLAFENTPSANIVADSKGLIVEFSKRAEQLFGYSSDEIVGKNVTLLMPEPVKSEHHKYLEKYLNTGEEHLIGSGGRLVTATHKNGQIFPINICIGDTVIKHELHFIASITDQTKQQKLEKQLHASKKMEAIGQLASGIAHDFNNLLGIAMGNLQLFQRKTTLDEKSSKNINAAIQALERGVTLTRQMLNFSRKSSTESEIVSLSNSIMEISNLIEQTATTKINTVYTLTKALDYVDINQGELGDALINLTANARDAMPDGGTLTIATSICSAAQMDNSSLNKDYLLLSVIDTGVGISNENIDKIFEPFFTTKTRSKGTGLGLATVYSFVKKVGGELLVSSVEGIGTTFKLYLPLSDQVPSEVIETIEQPILAGNETILLVDDEAELLSVAQSILEDAGYTIICATSGEQALDIIQNNNSIDLVLSDVIMPNGINGFELAVKAIYAHPALKVAITSGFTDKTKKTLVEGNLLAKYLADHLLPKPYNHQQLLQYVRSHLEGKIIVEWSHDLSVGVQAIDNDHKVLFDIVNKVHTMAALKPNHIEIRSTLEALSNYTSRHFRREEIIMNICNFPGLDNHIQDHYRMEKKVHSLIEKCKSNNFGAAEVDEMLRFFCTWLTEHIAKEDAQIASYTEEHIDSIYNALKIDSELFNDDLNSKKL